MSGGGGGAGHKASLSSPFSFPSLFDLMMGLLQTFDTILHGGVQQPTSYIKKRNYEFGDTLGIYHIDVYVYRYTPLLMQIMLCSRHRVFWLCPTSNTNCR